MSALYRRRREEPPEEPEHVEGAYEAPPDAIIQERTGDPRSKRLIKALDRDRKRPNPEGADRKRMGSGVTRGDYGVG